MGTYKTCLGFVEKWNNYMDIPAYQVPVVQSIDSLMSSLVVRMLTVLVSTISNSQVFLLKKCE